MSETSTPDLPTPPTPSDSYDRDRWSHSRLRRNMLYGRWRKHLMDRLSLQLGSIKQEAWGEPDMSSNVAASSCGSLATQYDRGVQVEHVAGESVKPLLEEIAETGLWSMKQRYQRDLLGMREMLMAIDVDEHSISYRPVFPDMATARSTAARPERPTRIREARLIEHGLTTWAYDEWSEAGLQVIECERGTVIGTRGPWLWSDGRPFLPYVMDHAARTGQLWDPYDQIELWDGTLSSAVNWTFLGHVLRDASWPQRWMLGCEIAGLNTEGSAAGNRNAVVTDPAAIVVLQAIANYAGQISTGSWQASADPQAILETCSAYERRVAARAGISPADIQRVAGDPRSGYAIAITREAQREAQRRFEPLLRPGDQELVCKTAAMVNRIRGTSYPESGYRIVYGSIPASSEEIAEGRAQADWETAQGISSPTSVYMRLHPGTPPEEAANQIVGAQLETLALKKRVQEEALILGLASPAQDENAAASGVVIQSAQSIVQAVAAGTMPRESGIALLVNLVGQTPERAEAIMASAGQGFSIPGANQ